MVAGRAILAGGGKGGEPAGEVDCGQRVGVLLRDVNLAPEILYLGEEARGGAGGEFAGGQLAAPGLQLGG